MVDLRPLVKAFNNCEEEDERRLVNFFLELFRLGVPRALMNFVTSGGLCELALSFESASAVCDTLNSIPGLSMLDSRADGRRVVERGEGAGLEKGKGVRVDKGDGVKGDKGKGVKVEKGVQLKEKGRQIVCCLPSIGREDSEVAKKVVERAKKVACAKGKRVAEEREKSGCQKVARLVRSAGGGVPWSRGVQIREDGCRLSPVKEEEETDSSLQILEEFVSPFHAGPSYYVDVSDDDEVRAEILIPDAEVRRRNVALLDMIDLISPSTTD